MELKNHDLAERPGFRRACSTRRRRCASPGDRSSKVSTSVRITLDNPTQHNSYTTDDGEGRDRRDAPRVERPRRGRGRVHRRRRPGLLHRREHRRSTPRTTPAGPRSTGSTCGSSTTWSAAILHCDKPVICRVNGMRIGGGQEIGMACDFTDRPGPRALRPGGPAPRLGPGRRQHRLPAALRRDRAAMESCTLCRAVERAQGAPPRASSTASSPPSRSDGAVRAEPARWSPTAGSTSMGRIVHGERQDGRGAAGRARRSWPRARSTSHCSTARSTRSCGTLANTMPGCLSKTRRERPQAQARALGPEPRDEPRVARPQHDDRGAGRLPRLPRGTKDRPRGRLPAPAAAPGGRCRWGDELIEEILRRPTGGAGAA